MERDTSLLTQPSSEAMLFRIRNRRRKASPFSRRTAAESSRSRVLPVHPHPAALAVEEDDEKKNVGNSPLGVNIKHEENEEEPERLRSSSTTKWGAVSAERSPVCDSTPSLVSQHHLFLFLCT